MKNILVTGGGGFIGSHTVVELVNAGYRPVIIDNFTNSRRSVLDQLEQITKQKIACYGHDYQDSGKLSKILQKEKVGGVIHFAASKSVGESVLKPLKYYDNNVVGFIKLLEVLEKYTVPNLVFSSSCTVYGEPDKLPIDESAPVKPASSPYGATKQICETVLQDVTKISKTLRSISLRYFNPIGAHQTALIGELPIGVPANLVPFITQTAAGIRKELIIHGNDYPTPDGSCIRDYLHVVDLAKAHVSALKYLDKQKGPHYAMCNVGTGNGYSVLEVVKTFEKVTGVKVSYKIGPRRSGDLVAIYAGVDKARKMLGWKAKKTLEDALVDAWRWQQNLTQKS